MGSLKHLSKSVLLGGLLVSAVAWSPPAAAHEEPSLPIISTEGRGEVSVDPDSFRISVGVVARDKDLDKARRSVNAKIERIIQALNALGIQGLSLRTEILQVSPLYPEPMTPAAASSATPDVALRPIIGYEVANGISVALIGGSSTEIGQHVSRIIGASLRSGANRAGNVEFFLQNAASAQNSALEAAVNAARRKADVIASATGNRIVKLQAVQEGYGMSPLAGQGAVGSMAFSEGDVTRIESGRILVSSNVTARFVFEKQ